jgi:hypothetical protein
MNIQGFIFNWKGHEQRAAALERKLGEFATMTVINSEEQLSQPRPDWVQLDDAAYFSEQWNNAIELFDADLFFHIQADADFDRFDLVFARAKTLFEKYRLGVYEPNVDYTGLVFDTAKLPPVEPNLLEVPFTDCTCWFIARDVVRAMPPVNLSVNRYGWGICRAIAALSRLKGRLCVRDYDFTIKHPKGTGYPKDSAREEKFSYPFTLSLDVRHEMVQLERIYRDVYVKPA